jgi:hypothetical protein
MATRPVEHANGFAKGFRRPVHGRRSVDELAGRRRPNGFRRRQERVNTRGENGVGAAEMPFPDSLTFGQKALVVYAVDESARSLVPRR